MTEFLLKNKLAFAGLIIVGLLTLIAIIAPWIAPYQPNANDFTFEKKAS